MQHEEHKHMVMQVRMDGSDGRTDMRMSMPHNVGAFYRESTKPDGSALCLGQTLAVADSMHALLMPCYAAQAMLCICNGQQTCCI